MIIDNLKSALLYEYRNTIDGPNENYRLVFKFNVNQAHRDSYFSKQIKKVFQVKVTVEEAELENKRVYKTVFQSPGGRRIFIAHRNNLSAYYSKMDMKDFKIETFFLEKEIMLDITSEGKHGNANLKLDDDNVVYDSKFVPFALSAFPFESDDPFTFKLFFYGTFSLYDVEAEKVGTEKIKVPLGEYDTFKLKLSPQGFYSLFSKNYLWYQKKSPHLLIKAEENVAWYLNAVWELSYIGFEKKEDLRNEMVASGVKKHEAP
jgi:hypothetical protein